MAGGDGEDDSASWIQELIEYNRQAMLFM